MLGAVRSGRGLLWWALGNDLTVGAAEQGRGTQCGRTVLVGRSRPLGDARHDPLQSLFLLVPADNRVNHFQMKVPTSDKQLWLVSASFRFKQ